jgi:hypothetical protein
MLLAYYTHGRQTRDGAGYPLWGRTLPLLIVIKIILQDFKILEDQVYLLGWGLVLPSHMAVPCNGGPIASLLP